VGRNRPNLWVVRIQLERPFVQALAAAKSSAVESYFIRLIARARAASWRARTSARRDLVPPSLDRGHAGGFDSRERNDFHSGRSPYKDEDQTNPSTPSAATPVAGRSCRLSDHRLLSPAPVTGFLTPPPSNLLTRTASVSGVSSVEPRPLHVAKFVGTRAWRGRGR